MLHASEQPKQLAESLPVNLVPKGQVPPGQTESPEVFSSYIEEIHNRAETISPLLQELLDRRPPPHWGLNE